MIDYRVKTFRDAGLEAQWVPDFLRHNLINAPVIGARLPGEIKWTMITREMVAAMELAGNIREVFAMWSKSVSPDDHKIFMTPVQERFKKKLDPPRYKYRVGMFRDLGIPARWTKTVRGAPVLEVQVASGEWMTIHMELWDRIQRAEYHEIHEIVHQHSKGTKATLRCVINTSRLLKERAQCQ